MSANLAVGKRSLSIADLADPLVAAVLVARERRQVDLELGLGELSVSPSPVDSAEPVIAEVRPTASFLAGRNASFSRTR